jgi:asparagine synthase (glutamine-hydrolysing)
MTTTVVGFCAFPPALDPGAKVEIVYWDGRLDNRRDLENILQRPLGADASDEMLALATYERWGIDGLGRVIGDWSLILRDPRRRAIVVASDYAGVRPLFYVRGRDGITWSSRLEELVEATGRTAIDEAYVAAFLTVGGHPSRTPYTGVTCVPAGRATTITPTGQTTRSIWSMPTSDVVRYADERRYEEQLRALFREGVAVRLQHVAPAIAELSGGLDSSSVVCMAHQLIRHGEVPAAGLATISYVHQDSLDYPFIKVVEAFCGIEGTHLSTHQTPLVAEDAVGRASPQIWVPLHTAAARVAARIGASTFLTGQNGDLVMGNWFDDSLQVAAPLRNGRLGCAMKDALAWSKVLRVPMTWILLRGLRATLPITTPDDLYAMDTRQAPDDHASSMSAAFLSRLDGSERRPLPSSDWRLAPPERRKHFLALTMMQDLRTLQVLEPVRHLDYTHPFAHRPLVEFLMSVPPEVLCRPGQPRRLMHRALGDLWPPQLRKRRSKSLFAAPWNEALRPLALAMLNTPCWQVVSRGWVDRGNLTARLHKLLLGLDCNESQLRQILLLEFWLRNRLHTPAIEHHLIA